MFAFAVVLALGAGVGPRAASAQTRPEAWRPGAVDSLRLWADAANRAFAESTADTITQRERDAFQLVHRIARRHFLSLGANRMRGAKGVLTVFDTLGVHAEFAQDEQLPQFCAVTFFNPKFSGYAALTYLYWWRGSELMSQSVRLAGGRDLQLDAWFTGIEVAPYEMALIDRRRTGNPRESFFTLLRMSRQADFWGVIQSGRKDVDLGGPGASRLVDLNGDGVPEIVNYSESPPDPRFVVNHSLPPLFSERVWERRDDGFQLLDRRTLASPFATFVLFLRALELRNVSVARELAATQAIVTKAQNLRLGTYAAPKSWIAVETPSGGPWNRTMRFAYGNPGAPGRGVEVGCKFTDGHWVIDKLESSVAKPDTTSAKR
jgi:hypothetical protein